MATETLVRPASIVRRKESTRPILGTKRAADVELSGSATKKSRSFHEPFVRDSQYILKKHNGKAPSLKLHLHATHFRFDGQDGSFAYDSPMRFVLKHLQMQTVPHDMLEELLASGVPFYDGCLIVEVHNHRNTEGQKNGSRTSQNGEDHKKFSVHNWNPHVTPSAGASFPDKSQLEPETSITSDTTTEKGDGSKTKGKEEPTITTIVLHPTEQTRHEEMLILARTPAADVRRKKGAEGSAQTPAVSVPPTPSASTARNGTSQKMALDQAGLYAFQSELLVATETPLLLDPAENAEHADRILDSLQHPLHSGKPPVAKERKRTTAEMAADDAQAAESERRMLFMDERIKPSARSGTGNTTGETQATAASLGFSRFKTIENVKQRIEEQERIKKEKDAIAAQEKRQQEEQAAIQQRQLAQQAQQAKQREMQDAQARQRALLMQQQKHSQQVTANAQAQAQHQAELIKQMNAQQMNQTQQNGFQGSTMPAQQTPLMAQSSPMVNQNGFPMVPTSSQGAGSPPRPASAVIAQPNGVGMSRGASQQTHTSMHNTPHIQQNGTPALANAVPNRNMNQTPHLNPSSPMVGTPSSNMPMTNARLNGNLDTAQQNLILQQMQQNNQQSLGGQMTNGQAAANGAQNMSPEHFSQARQMQRLEQLARQSYAQAQALNAQGNQAAAQQLFARAQQAQQQYQAYRARILGAQAANAQGTPNANHTHPQGMNGQANAATPQQANNVTMLNPQQQSMQNGQPSLTPQQQQVLRGQHELRRLLQQHNGNIPPQVVQQMPPLMQSLLRQQQQRQHQQQVLAARTQAQARIMLGNQASPNSGVQSAQYMQNMQAMRNTLAMQMQGQQANGQGVNGNMGMNMNNMQGFTGQRQQNQQQQSGSDLSQSFAAMQNALTQGHGMT